MEFVFSKSGRGVPLSTVSWSCKEELKIGLRWPVVWRLTLSGVGRMITYRRLNILCRINTKRKLKIQQKMSSESVIGRVYILPIVCPSILSVEYYWPASSAATK